MRKALALMLVCFATPVLAGEVEVLRGDTIRTEGTTIRLAGIVAPNYSQAGYFETNEWVQSFLKDKRLVCSTMPTLTRDKVLGECAYRNAQGRLIDLASTIVRNGFARACPTTGKNYIQDDVDAHRERLGTTQDFNAPRSCF
jgi:endonuclease YncB( thermonuclease family)